MLYTWNIPKERTATMALYTIEANYKNRHCLTIEAPDADTAVQIFYQKGGGDPIDGDGWDDFDVEELDEDSDEFVDYTAEDYDPEGGKTTW